MTTTAINTSQSIGTSTNVGPDKFATRTTANSLSDRFFVEVKITNGAAGYDRANKVRCWFASYSASVTASTAPDLLRKAAQCFEVTPSQNAGVARVMISDCQPLTGGYIYVWFDIPNLAVACTLDATLIEGP